MTPSRRRLVSMAALVVSAGVAALSWSQPWYLLRLSGAEQEVRGDVAAGAIAPVALASLVLVLALTLAGPVFRVILSILNALLGACVIAVAVWSLSDPRRAIRPLLTELTGIEGPGGDSMDQVASVVATAWPAVGVIGGVLMVLTGIAVALTSTAWPTAGSRYSRTRATTPEGDAIQDWDALSEGEDPTETPR